MGILKKIIPIISLILVFFGGFFVNIQSDIIRSNDENQILELNLSFSSEVYAHNDQTGVTDSNVNKGDKSSGDNVSDNAFKTIISILNGMLGIFMVIVSPIILLAGWLMSPDWVTGDIFGLREKMHALWITVSNVLYFVYAVFLLVIAIATIFNSQTYGYKQMLPRLFIGIILIPFTWWFVQFIISTATVVTATVLKIPTEMMGKIEGTDGWWEQKNIPNTLTFGTNKTSNEAEMEKCEKSGQTSQSQQNIVGCTSAKEIMQSGVGIYSPMFIYSFGIFKIQDIKKLPENATGVDIVAKSLDLAGGLFFSTILFIIFGILTIALVFILFVRAIKLWIYAIFSPLFTAKVVFKDWKGEGGGDMFDIKEFIGLAFVPAIIGLALSFGLIVISTIRTGLESKAGECDMRSKEGCLLMTIAGNPNNTITAKIEGDTGGDGNNVTSTGAASITTVKFGTLTFAYKGSIEPGAPAKVKDGGFLGAFGTVILQFIGLVFIWIAFMAASKVSKGVAAVIAPFESIGKNMADMGKSSIKMMPLPVVGNIGGIEKTMEYAKTAQATKMHNQFSKSSMGDLFNIPVKDIKVENTIRNAMNIKIDNSTSETDAKNAGMKAKDAISNAKTAGYRNEQIRQDVIIQLITSQLDSKVSQQAIKQYLTGMGITNPGSMGLNTSTKENLIRSINNMKDSDAVDLFSGNSNLIFGKATKEDSRSSEDNSKKDESSPENNSKKDESSPENKQTEKNNNDS